MLDATRDTVTTKAMTRVAEDGLRLLTIGLAMSHGYSFSPRCFLDISDMIANGLADLQEGDKILNETMLDAQVALTRIVSEMITEAVQQGKDELEESIFHTVKNLLCPWPPWFKEPCSRSQVAVSRMVGELNGV